MLTEIRKFYEMPIPLPMLTFGHNQRLFALLCLLLSGLASPACAWTLEGNVSTKARPQNLRAVVPPQYHEACGSSKNLPRFQIRADGAVKNAVVWIDPIDAGNQNLSANIAWRQKGYRLDQTQCEFNPHVLLASPDTPVYIINSDSIAHNVGLSFAGKAVANVVLPKKDMLIKKTFREPGPHLVQCGIHPWMSAIIFIQKHPWYAITPDDGTFRFGNLPAGRYLLQTWHEGFGKTRRVVSAETGFLSISLA